MSPSFKKKKEKDISQHFATGILDIPFSGVWENPGKKASDFRHRLLLLTVNRTLCFQVSSSWIFINIKLVVFSGHHKYYCFNHILCSRLSRCACAFYEPHKWVTLACILTGTNHQWCIPFSFLGKGLFKMITGVHCNANCWLYCWSTCKLILFFTQPDGQLWSTSTGKFNKHSHSSTQCFILKFSGFSFQLLRWFFLPAAQVLQQKD